MLAGVYTGLLIIAVTDVVSALYFKMLVEKKKLNILMKLSHKHCQHDRLAVPGTEYINHRTR